MDNIKTAKNLDVELHIKDKEKKLIHDQVFLRRINVYNKDKSYSRIGFPNSFFQVSNDLPEIMMQISPNACRLFWWCVAQTRITKSEIGAYAFFLKMSDLTYSDYPMDRRVVKKAEEELILKRLIFKAKHTPFLYMLNPDYIIRLIGSGYDSRTIEGITSSNNNAIKPINQDQNDNDCHDPRPLFF